ncbi:glycosyl transferase [Phyllobacterium sp. YR531]|nr:glycosyl transferase [Phyllobacterium sp. YR531]
MLISAVRLARESARVVKRRIRYHQIVRESRTSTLTLVRSHRTVAERKPVIVIMTVRNEIIRIRASLTFYRSLGINEFYIVDNGSTDGTKAFLEQQSDVTLYETSQSYKRACYGILWTNWLMHKHAKGRWVLFVDADELFHFDTSIHATIFDLINDLEGSKQTYFFAPLIDLYGFSDLAIATVVDISDLYAVIEAAWYDTQTYKSGGILPNGYRALLGGPRTRLSMNGPLSNLTKYPLIQHQSDRYFTASSHEFAPQRREAHQFAGCLLHLKLGNRTSLQHSDPSIEKEHYRNGAERKSIALSKNSDDLLYPSSSKFNFNYIIKNTLEIITNPQD